MGITARDWQRQATNLCAFLLTDPPALLSPLGSIALRKQPAFCLLLPCSPPRKRIQARAYQPSSTMGFLGFNFQLKDQVQNSRGSEVQRAAASACRRTRAVQGPVACCLGKPGLAAPQRRLCNSHPLAPQLVFYGSYHSNPVNQLIHFIFVPAIWWTVAGKPQGRWHCPPCLLRGHEPSTGHGTACPAAASLGRPCTAAA